MSMAQIAGNQTPATELTMPPKPIQEFIAMRISPMRIYLQDYAALLGFTLSLLFILAIAFA
jgi:hypothetical protein